MTITHKNGYYQLSASISAIVEIPFFPIAVSNTQKIRPVLRLAGFSKAFILHSNHPA